MAQIQVSSFSEMLARRLGIAGHEGVAGELGAEVSPVIVLENDRPEWLYLGNVRLWTAVIALGAGGAGNFATCRLRNPLGSGVLGVLLGLQISVTTISEVKIWLNFAGGAVDATTPQTIMSARDSRWGAQTSGAIKASSKNDATTGTGIIVWDHFLAVNTPTIPQVTPIVLAPDSAIDIVNVQGNQGIFLNAIYTERKIEAYEVK